MSHPFVYSPDRLSTYSLLDVGVTAVSNTNMAPPCPPGALLCLVRETNSKRKCCTLVTDEVRALKEKSRFSETAWEGQWDGLLGWRKGVRDGLSVGLIEREADTWVGVI